MSKKDAILIGPFVGEMFWEFFRFAPYVFKKIHNQMDKTIVVYTRKDRFDIYGKYVDKFKEVYIEGDGTEYFGECFRLMNFPQEEYKFLVKEFYNNYAESFNIIDHIYPRTSKPRYYLDKNFYPMEERLFNYRPREKNEKKIKEFLQDVNKKIIILAPRYRFNFKRNWNHWEELYNLIYRDKFLMNKYEFILCGKKQEYIPDKKNRFKDLNDIEVDKKSSRIGLLMALMERAYLTVGSQSAIPNISSLYEVPSIQWGNQKKLHTVTYNIKNTPIKFIEDMDFNIHPKIVFELIKKYLAKEN